MATRQTPINPKKPLEILYTRKLSWIDIAEQKFKSGLITWAQGDYQLIDDAYETQMYLAIMSYYGMFE